MQLRAIDGTRQERTGWRDQEISSRHRLWGFNCPAVDLDFLVVEYNLGKPVGLIEYKHFNARTPDLKHATYMALRELSDIGGLPFMVVFYWPGIWAFRVQPANEIALEHFDGVEVLTERNFVKRLYRMRRLVLSEHLQNKLNDQLPDECPF